MSMKTIRKAQQMTGEEIATISSPGVARTLAARQAAGVELSNEELSQVNNGVALNGGVTQPSPIFSGVYLGLRSTAREGIALWKPRARSCARVHNRIARVRRSSGWSAGRQMRQNLYDRAKSSVSPLPAPAVGVGTLPWRRRPRCLAAMIVQWLPSVVDTLPPCAIRPACRWWQQEGKAACVRCPQVVTETFKPIAAMRHALQTPHGGI